MAKRIPLLEAKFVGTHFVDENYHSKHPQLLHQHDDVLELFYPMKGNGFYSVAGRKYALHPGHLVICNAGILHGEAPFQAHTMESYCVVLKDLHLPGLPPNNLMRDNYHAVLEFRGEQKLAVEHLMLSIHSLYESGEDDGAVCDLLANGLLNLVWQELKKEAAAPDPEREKTEEFISQIIAYLDAHYTESLSLPQIGDYFHMSHYHLAHIFKTQVGQSPMRYVLQRKIGQAQNLLMNTKLPVGEIGDSLGFTDNCHFSSTFKKYVGITPTQYRRNFQSERKKSQ
ncbi:MAG: helix-turn-helix domain-containing protein [Butyricicoccus sp.]|nr:helix-turn-helix domain-containing protein [Butyricicoccus sp.]